jgi:hypothetical protein
MEKLNRWSYLGSKFVETLDRKKRLKMNAREKLGIAQKKMKKKEKDHKRKHEKVEESKQRISLLTLLTET